MPPIARKDHLDGLASSILLACCLFWGVQQVMVKATLPESERKSLTARAALAQQADATFLCLPDDAARELVDALEGKKAVASLIAAGLVRVTKPAAPVSARPSASVQPA